MSENAGLAGLRVFVAEDEVLLAMLLEEMLDDLACTTVGPFANLPAALEAASGGGFDVALVDMNLMGETAEPLVAELSARGIPLAIASGGSAVGEHVMLGKPYGFNDLARALATLRAALPDRT